MSIARSTGALVGTSESTGVTIANNATSGGSEVDLLGDNTSVGDLALYLCFTSTVTVGSLDVKVNRRRVTGVSYAQAAAQFSIPPINGSAKYYLGTIPATRYVQVDVTNNATGASATNVAVLCELAKLS